jgi:hypothetical protein
MANTHSRNRRSALIPWDSSTLSVEDTEDVQRRTCTTPTSAVDIQQPLLKNPFEPTSTTSSSNGSERQEDDSEIAGISVHGNGDESHTKVDVKSSDKKIRPAFRRKWRKRGGKRVSLLQQPQSFLRDSRLRVPYWEDVCPIFSGEKSIHPSGPLLPPPDHDCRGLSRDCGPCGK